MKSTQLPFATITLREDDIVHIDYADNYHHGVEEAKAIFNSTRELCGDEKYRLPLLLTGGLKTMNDPEFRAFNSSEEVMKHVSAVGVVVKSLTHVIIVNFFIKFNKPKSPTRFFKNEDHAIAWLTQYAGK